SGLADESVDIALLYDTLHNLNDPDSILAELHRVLKQGGTLSVNDHHLEDDDIISKISGNKLFQLHHKGEINLNFKPFK
ncbi:MAG: methyltransferase domain-containing protein, partial [Deltaproteobacteria bacterium]|nr:methyltransferase domain-containing protein [Deltaproteobacteria bacterium]